MTARTFTRRTLLAGVAGAAASMLTRRWCTASAAPVSARQSLATAAEFLWQQQGDDGGWHSPQYGVLRSGQALTPFVLDALLAVPESVTQRPSDGVERAIAFILSRIDADGCIGRQDPDVIEYPIYSSAYALRCLSSAGRKLRDFTSHLPMAELAGFLSNSQFHEANGFTDSHPAFGGWGFDAPRQPGQPGHMDLAHTRCALEALAAHQGRDGSARKSNQDRLTQRRAQAFLRVVQKHPQAAARPHLSLPVDGPASTAPPPLLFDGGFYFSPIVLEANKGRVDENPTPHWRSYATATCDGILALLAAGVPRDDERVTAAEAWLRRHSNLDYPQGVPTDHPEPWGEAIRFYHYAVRAEAYRRLDCSAGERAALAALVQSRQAADGSFVNDASPLMKEDDPVLCTALATVALTNCLV